jgi:predicted TIM-barrel enzyme
MIRTDWSLSSIMTRVIIRQYRDVLLSDIGSEQRSLLHKQLIKKEDKLGKDLQLLADIERHIADTCQRIEAQQVRVSTIQANGRDGLVVAQALLDGLIESQQLSMEYRQRVMDEIEGHRL